MLKRAFILCAFFLNLAIAIAQSVEVDSLENLLQKHTATDTFRVNILNKAAYKSFTFDIAKTLFYASKADSLSEILKYRKGKAESIRLKGFYYEEMSDFPKALEHYQLALQIFIDIDEKTGIANSFNNLGIIYRVQGDGPTSMEYFHKALKVYEETGDKKGMANSYNNIGIVFHDQNDSPKALEYYQKSLQIAEELNDISGISNSYINIGIVYHDQKDYPKALEYYQQSLKISEEIGDINSIVLNCINTGLMYSLMKEYAKASDCFTRGLRISKKIRSKSLEAWNLYGLGSISLDQNKIDLAYNYAQRAYSLASEIGEAEIIRESSEILSKASAALGLYKDAYEYQLIFKALSDSVMNEENTRRTIGLEYEYKYEQEKQIARLEQEKKEAIHKEELKHQKNIRNSFILALLMALFVLALVYYSFVQKRKTNRLLTEQKNEIIMRNEELQQLNEEIRSQKEHIEKSHEQMTESITYAQLIQKAVLPNHEIVSMLFPNHFVLYLPCDIVSGDFYFIKQVKQFTIIAAADCTGHGVPGAFMSMLGIALLNEIVRHTDIHKSSQVLTELRDQLKRSLQQSGKIGEQPEGMDIAFCAINLETMDLSFAGAHNPCWIFREDDTNKSKRQLIILEADRIPLGVSSVEKPFTEHTMKLQKGDTLYLFSDGYYTQFGGERKEKLQAKRLQAILEQIQDKDMQGQKLILEDKFNEWKGKNSQTDDVLVVGFKI